MGVHVHHLTSVDGEIVFDMDPDVVSPAAGGTVLADGVTTEELAALARSTTYTFAVFELRTGGAAAGVRPRLLAGRDETMQAYIEEIVPLVESERFVTGPDLGTSHGDFTAFGRARSYADMEIDGILIEDVAAGRGVVAAAGAWLSGLDGRTFAIEGFGTVGGALAREVVRQGGRVVAVSTTSGAVANARGFDPDALVEARAEHGDGFVTELGVDVHRARELHELPVDVLVPGGRAGVYGVATAKRVAAKLIAPGAYAPYTRDGLDILRDAGVETLPDFVCSAGSVLVNAAPAGLTADEVLTRTARLITERITGAREASMDPIHFAGQIAETFLATWVPPDHRPDSPLRA